MAVTDGRHLSGRDTRRIRRPAADVRLIRRRVICQRGGDVCGAAAAAAAGGGVRGAAETDGQPPITGDGRVSPVTSGRPDNNDSDMPEVVNDRRFEVKERDVDSDWNGQ